MRLLSISYRDFNYHFKKNSGYYYCFLFALVVSLTISIIIVLTSDNYLNLLVSKNKNLYSYINGTVSYTEMFFNNFLKFSLPLVIIFVLGLNYYSSLISYIFVGYQFSIFIMTIVAIINVYLFSGVLTCIFFIIPINILYFVCLVFMSVVCIERSSYANRTKYFKEAMNSFFFSKIFICFLFVLLISILISFVFPLILKSAIFFIYW